MLGETLNKWATWMKSAGMSQRTITARVQLIELFARRQEINPVKTGWEPVADFLGDDRFSAGTRQTYQAHFRTWFHWLVLMDYRIDDPTLKLHKGRPVRRRPRPVTVAQLGTILSTRMHHRTRAMIYLGAYEGFRVHEIAKFQGDDIVGDMVGVTGKGSVYEEVPLHPLVEEIATLMPARDFWFPSHTCPGPVLANSVSTIITQVMRRAGLPDTRTAHSLRHFFGTEALKTSGGNLVIAKRLMRHANIASTVIYTEVEVEEMRAALLALPVPVRLRAVA